MLVLVLVLVLSVVLSQLMVEINTNPGLAEKAGPDAAQICAVVLYCTKTRPRNTQNREASAPL